MSKKFLRRNTTKLLRLGKKRKKIQKWRNPTGRSNKMREKRRGYPKVVSVGYKNKKEERSKILNKKQIQINNVENLHKLTKETIGVLGRMGKKKKIEISKHAREMNVKILNLKKIERNIKNQEKENKK